MTGLPNLTLTYFPIGARAEPIRLAAAIGKVPFKNKAISPSSWPEVKKTLALRQLPVLEIEKDGKVQVIPQSNAILRYIGKLGGLYPDDYEAALRVDSFIDTAASATKPIEISIMGPQPCLISEEGWTKETVMKMRERISSDKSFGLPFYLAYFEAALRENGTGWLVGNKTTIADLALYRIESWISSGNLDGVPPSLLNEYFLLKGHQQKIENLKEVKEWREKTSIPYSTFDFKP